MFIAKKHLSRRTVLRGVGAAVSLPLLDAMIPAGTALAQTAARAKPKLGFFYLSHGAVIDRWTPAATGRAFEPPQILKPFAPFQADMTVVSGSRNKAAEGAGVHTVNPGTWLSCQSPFWKSDAWMPSVPPITCVTAIASPIARPSPSVTAATRPPRVYGRTTPRIISQRVRPSP